MEISHGSFTLNEAGIFCYLSFQHQKYVPEINDEHWPSLYYFSTLNPIIIIHSISLSNFRCILFYGLKREGLS